MVSKLKKCCSCLEESVIWKSQGRDKYCKNCWYKHSPPKTIKKISDKKKELDKEYFIKREKFLAQFKNCQASLHCCTNLSTEIHHLYFGSDRSQHYTDFDNVIAICRNCHREIHDKMSTEEAVSLGLRKLKTYGEETEET